jgi:hypothetical protein
LFNSRATYILDVQLCVPLGICKLWRSKTGHFPNCRTRDQSAFKGKFSSELRTYMNCW